MDPEIFDIIEREKESTMERLGVDSVGEFYLGFDFEALGSVMTNKYSEGYLERDTTAKPRIDMAEFVPKESVGGVSFEPRRMGSERSIVIRLSGELSSVHGAVEPGDRIMGLTQPHGGALVDGFQTDAKKISATSIYFNSICRID